MDALCSCGRALAAGSVPDNFKSTPSQTASTNFASRSRLRDHPEIMRSRMTMQAS